MVLRGVRVCVVARPREAGGVMYPVTSDAALLQAMRREVRERLHRLHAEHWRRGDELMWFRRFMRLLGASLYLEPVAYEAWVEEYERTLGAALAVDEALGLVDDYFVELLEGVGAGA